MTEHSAQTNRTVEGILPDDYNTVLEAIKSDVLDNLPPSDPRLSADDDTTLRSSLLWDVMTGENAVFAALAGILGLCVLLSVSLTLYVLFTRRQSEATALQWRHHRLQDNFRRKSRAPTAQRYIYIEDESEGTFTGVSIPLMQDVSKI